MNDSIAILREKMLERLTSAPSRRIRNLICHACCNGARGGAYLTLKDWQRYRFLRDRTEEQTENDVDESEVSEKSKWDERCAGYYCRHRTHILGCLKTITNTCTGPGPKLSKSAKTRSFLRSHSHLS